MTERVLVQSITEWLEEIKAGYSERFAACFDEVGLEDTADLGGIPAEELNALEEALRKAGAKKVHMRNINTAIAALTAARTGEETLKPVPPDRPAPSNPSPRKVQSTTEHSSAAAAYATVFAAFLSHFKLECGTEARLVQLQLQTLLDEDEAIFLDSDDLEDLRSLLQHVKNSRVIVLLQSKGVLTRPWVILELYTAITQGVPVVALNVQNAFRYDYGMALDFLCHFDREIELANPGAASMLMDHNVDPVEVAYRLSDALPNIISTDFSIDNITSSSYS
jgi:hypothetical protein